MSLLFLSEGVVHYEYFGHGAPVIFLHGWLGSWRYWVPSMETLGAAGYRCYAPDFWGYGDSEKERQSFRIEDQVQMLDLFVRELGFARCHLVGHSSGGVVALRFAAENPGVVEKVVVVNTPLVGDALSRSYRLSLKLGEFGRRRMMTRLLKQIKSGWEGWYEEVVNESLKASEEAIRQTLESLLHHDLRPLLSRRSFPLLAVYGEKDDVVDPKQAEHLDSGRPDLQVILFPNARHFPFLDDPPRFARLLVDFFEAGDRQRVRVKKTWRRRVRQREYL